MATNGEVREAVFEQVNDVAHAFWSDDEVDGYLDQAYREIARVTRCVWDLRYAENLPASFSYTQPWELPYAQELGFDAGCANYTNDDERRLLEETHRIGPANHTSPFEATAGWLSAAGASTAISATAELPRTVTEIDRPMWDQRAIVTISPKQATALDSRYEITAGEVYALIPTAQGIRTIRKMRVPSAQADTYAIAGSWGVMRSPAECSSGTVTGTYGIPRCIPGHHPMGTESFGLPRRPYRDGKNVRIEHWREGRAVTTAADVYELPTRATVYLRDYAIGRCYGKSGPAQDLRLAQHYQARYQRGVERLKRRVQAQQRARVSQLGGASPIRSGPPRPRLPWQYGTVVR